jgi:hypothetical protein
MVFTDDSQTKGEGQNTELNREDGNQAASFVDQLAATKGDNWRDPEVLAKGKIEADSYISTLEKQLAEIREELQKKDYDQEVLSRAKSKATESSTENSRLSNNRGAADVENTTRQISEDDLKSLVEQTLSQRQKEETLKSNLSFVDEELTKTYGTEASSVIKQKATELGMTMDRLKEIAEESPNAFFTLIGEKKRQMNPLISGSVRTEGVNMGGNSERNFNYYQKVRKENRALYFSPKFQQQMMNDAERLGDKFY